MKRPSHNLPSNLPSLQPNSKHSQSRDSVKLIQTKINQHQNQITRNQKVIITLTNDFRLLKDQLHAKMKENEQVKEMYTKAIEQNQKYTKTNKELRQTILKLQKTVQQKQKDKKILSARQEDPQKYNKMNEQINILKAQVNQMSKVIKVLQNNNQQLIKENQKSKDSIEGDKKNLIQKMNKLQAQFNGKSSVMNKVIRELRDELQAKNKQLKQQDQQLSKMKNYVKQKQKIAKDYPKLQRNYKQLRANFQRISTENKERKNKIEQLEKQIKIYQDQGNKISQASTRIKEMESNQISIRNKNAQLEKQLQKLKQDNNTLAVQKQKNKKKLEKVKKMFKVRPQLVKAISTMETSIKCDLCSKLLDKPVTSIPCGHSFCFDCKKGYEKQCKKCVGVKREAVYRNQLLDQLINGYKLMLQISEHLNILE